tara:strand:+ start:1671 stop:2909 length:1239 start_codon:yes stop_codon:yes gene_type:complete
VWIFQTGEPLHIDSENPRPMRAMNLCNKLVDRGHDVVLWSSAFNHQKKIHRSRSSESIRINRNFEIRLIPSCGYKKHIGLARLVDHGQMAINFKRLLNQEKFSPDVAFIGYPPIEAATVFSNWLLKRNIPAMLDVKDLWPQMFVDALPNFLQPLGKIFFYPYFYLAKKTFRNVNSISAMTPSFLSWVLNFADRKQTRLDRVFRLTSSDENSKPQDLTKADIWWQEQGVSKDQPVIFFVGTFMSVFDFKPVQHAAKNLAKKGVKCQFVLCGAGDYLEEIKLMMKGLTNVFFPGWINKPQIESLAKMSIASVAPYKNIDNYILNTPNKIVDAFLLGLPVLSPLKGEVAKLIETHKVGFTYGEFLTLEQCILDLIDDKALQNKISRNARNLYSEEFEFNKVYNNLVMHLEELSSI